MKKAIPLLEGLFRFTQSPYPDACSVDSGWNESPNSLKSNEKPSDRSPELRRAMVQIIEPNLSKEIDLLLPLQKERDPRVAEQLIFTLGTIDDPKAEEMIQSLASNHLVDEGHACHGGFFMGKRDLPFVKK